MVLGDNPFIIRGCHLPISSKPDDRIFGSAMNRQLRLLILLINIR
jgi:hypothetical protein